MELSGTKRMSPKSGRMYLAKHGPIICKKVSSARRTGGGSPTAELTELEAKLKSIKGKELFEGVVGVYTRTNYIFNSR